MSASLRNFPPCESGHHIRVNALLPAHPTATIPPAVPTAAAPIPAAVIPTARGTTIMPTAAAVIPTVMATAVPILSILDKIFHRLGKALVGWHRRRFGYVWKQRNARAGNGNNSGGTNHAAQKSAATYEFHCFLRRGTKPIGFNLEIRRKFPRKSWQRGQCFMLKPQSKSWVSSSAVNGRRDDPRSAVFITHTVFFSGAAKPRNFWRMVDACYRGLCDFRRSR